MSGDIYLYMATELWDPLSALIRERTECAWSHVGFYRRSDDFTFSAMCDGKGVAWRPVKDCQKILLLQSDGSDAALARALTQEGKPYDVLDIAGLALGRDWQSAHHFICSVLVLWAFDQSGNPLVNMRFIPSDHFAPRDILLSQKVSLLATEKMATGAMTE